MPTIYNKVVIDNTTLMDISDTTATASDVASGKYFYTANGTKTEGTATSSGGSPAISVVDTTDSNGGTIRTITAIDISDTTAVAADVTQGKYFYTAQGIKTLGTASGGSAPSGQTVTGTVTGNGSAVLEIPCSFEPDLIYVHSDLSDDATKRGVVSITIIKDRLIDMHSDASTSAASETMYYASHDVTGYNENDDSNPHASYANGVLTITSMNSSATKFLSGQVYSYELSTIGTGGSSAPSATSHSIYFEFSDGTNTTLTYYDNEGTFINSAITATKPTTYGNKTVTLAQLDGVTWYEPTSIPLNTQLVDYTKITTDHSINPNGELVADQWYGVTDYIVIDPSMTFSYKGHYWGYNAFYDSSKTFISSFNPYDEDMDTASGNNNVGVGTLGGSGITIPSNAVYIRITTLASPNDTICSLIRTA